MPDQLDRPVPWKKVSASKPRWARPFVVVEWSMEWVVFALRRWALVELLPLLGSFTLLVGLISYCSGADDRQRAYRDQRAGRQYLAWQSISAAQGKPGNGGRIQALQDLARDSVPLSGVDVSGAWLQGLTLIGARLDGIRADSANLMHADLRLSDLSGASLDGADLSYADLRGANLRFASLRGARLNEVCLDGASLVGADLTGANLIGVSFVKSDLSVTDLRWTRVWWVLLDSANLFWTDFRGADVRASGMLRARDLEGVNLAGLAPGSRTSAETKADSARMRALGWDSEQPASDSAAWEAERDENRNLFRFYGEFELERADSADALKPLLTRDPETTGLGEPYSCHKVWDIPSGIGIGDEFTTPLKSRPDRETGSTAATTGA